MTPGGHPSADASGVSGGPPRSGTAEAGPRPRRRGVWVFLAIVTAFAVVAPAALWAVERAVRRTSTSMTPYRHAIKDVRLDMGDARVSVGPGPEGEARVFKRLTWALRKPAVGESLIDDVLYVTFRCDDPSALTAGLECGGDIDVQVPPGVRVSAVSSSGEINVRGLTGDLDLRTGAGEIGVAGARGRLRLQAGAGTLRGTGLAASKTLARVTSGELDLRYAEPPGYVEATAGAGSVKVIVPPGSRYRVPGWSGSGSSHLNPAIVDDASPNVIAAYSRAGSTYVDVRDD
ncbi:hypothetical protein AGRA3207_001590 [Actinomadura graeca]|uniref:DUF4097 domain-containing protein n=1 Tax=Actinomadura graeca TaxID=2750812 RepID=A0ABX8QST0_9ACTN|nr:DUF4097 domain-containing protein [Actinomadura graeca]QXJ20812.1 hypothetical protein AGRA3207_001590 [Actinomadura graeca]